jgi:hypothetical protein
MGWIQEQFEQRIQSETPRSSGQNPLEMRFEALATRKWQDLVAGLKRDLDEYQKLGGDADFTDVSDQQCQISNPNPGVIARVIADPDAHTIQYTFESKAGDTAVPEGGFLSIRRSQSNGADLYSADQRISNEDARRLILEPLLFPNRPRAA